VYTGAELFSGRACSLDIRSTGVLALSYDGVVSSIDTPYFFTQFSKTAYAPSTGLSPTGYTILWLVAGPKLATQFKSPQIFFKFNDTFNDVLTMEYTRFNTTGVDQVVTCQLRVS
jgi:hypothetical protein